jgi:hypothetical protein
MTFEVAWRAGAMRAGNRHVVRLLRLSIFGAQRAARLRRCDSAVGGRLPHCPVRRVVLSWCRLAADNLGNYVAGLARNTIQHGQDGGLPPARTFDSGHTGPIGQQASGDAAYRLTGPCALITSWKAATPCREHWPEAVRVATSAMLAR